MTADVELPPIEHDEGMNRTYIPLPGGWEVQTKGKGSTFRICEPGDDPMRLSVPATHYLHNTLARMARDIHAAVSHATAAKDAEIEALRAEVEKYKVAWEEFSNRTEWVQQTAKPRELGMHRADVLRQRVEQAEARAERLAEALRWYVENDDTNEGQEGNEYWLAGRDRAIAALNPTAAQENDDA